ncbi:unnamed protein product [Fusarium graminearum]|uniref:Chromosome 2, complete genome n=1 Tax=Gibberella zeae (strain ATCC MYA-4620 / CBS 123657 / FGSC 9075 / NRRL 31084 / PH-1) TaxID=229533 RepID=A0A098DDV8_GIBZE|nr:unnamed protein product [Fusarium graminearum]CZS80434.1 unnamed protein product [Fusarium graminearum]
MMIRCQLDTYCELGTLTASKATHAIVSLEIKKNQLYYSHCLEPHYRALQKVQVVAQAQYN